MIVSAAGIAFRVALATFGLAAGVMLGYVGLGGGLGSSYGDTDDAWKVGGMMAVSTTGAGAETQSGPRYSRTGHDITPLTDERIEELAQKLTPEQREIILSKGTERPFCGTLLDNKKTGFYGCALCDLPLFGSGHKFDSGTGWPSFFRPGDPEHVGAKQDNTLGMKRVEIVCARCDGHLGHVFDDGPKPTGLRFCVNSESLVFFEEGESLPEGAMPVQTKTAYFAGGCFWGIEHHFQNFPGVVSAVSGYQGGRPDQADYRSVSTGNSGHAEVVRVTYDPDRVNYRTLLRAFFAMHDPTQLNRQGPDFGSQYRGAIFAVGEDQKKEAEAYIETLRDAGTFDQPIVTEVRLAEDAPFFEAEDYHQDYVERTGRACHAMRPIGEMPE